MNGYKDFHTLTCISAIKTYVTDLVSKDENNFAFLFIKTLVSINVYFP